ncbi:MAG: cation diffusion facilitator family transporter [Litorivicinaceae bacterium]
MTNALPRAPEASRVMTRVTLVGAMIDALLGVGKIALGWVTQSHALVADGVHSLSDLGTDALVLLAARVSHEAPDAEHPYGHARFETLATLILGSVLLLVAGGILWDGIERALQESLVIKLNHWAFAVVLVSIAAKEAIYWYTLRAARQIGSTLLEANAWHSRTDALSSVAVLAGLVGVWAGYPLLDAVAASVVAVLIAKIAVELLWESVQELVDRALPADESARLHAVAMAIDGVRDIHHMRTRTMAGRTLMDIHLEVSPGVSVSEGHEIGCWVAAAIREAAPHVADITFHIDPENDEELEGQDPVVLRPLRHEVLALLGQHWSAWVDAETTYQLHYVRGGIDVDLGFASDAPATAAQLKDACKDLAWLGDVRVWQRVTEPARR